MPARKAQTHPTAEDVPHEVIDRRRPPQPPGDHRIEIRVNDKIVFLQRIFGYTIDQEDDQFALYGWLTPPAEEASAEPTPAPEAPAEPVGDDAA